jgi:DNA modification methylase
MVCSVRSAEVESCESTLLAAHQLQRVGYGVEIDPGYVAVALERLSLVGLKPELTSQ